MKIVPQRVRPAQRIGVRWKWARAAGSVGLLALLFSEVVGFAQKPTAPLPPDVLPFSKGYQVTGNYIVGGVDFTSQANPADSNGLATGTIAIGDAETAGGVHLVGAYLYWKRFIHTL